MCSFRGQLGIVTPSAEDGGQNITSNLAARVLNLSHDLDTANLNSSGSGSDKISDRSDSGGGATAKCISSYMWGLACVGEK